ncbi:peptidylprolyl isomerase [Methylocella tundrae]|uniref:Parvulin-like PPIase n=1 Tax=Methylocella tundrae TaxID=227605 RepID=A0A4U8Z3M2_METTU|nr:peptidylprolyl isomerase [Methylocella tundrae]WPP03715.1 peptidylprolyl isomerase [Methylocella tundrae]VFU09860.1 Peptidylprolyl isomerase [Methylocella tundrae]
MFKKTSSRALAAGLACALAIGGPSLLAADEVHGKVLATVNGQPITDEDLKIATEDLGPSLPAQVTGKAREAYLLDFLIDGMLVAQKAQAEKLDKTKEFADKLAYYHEKLLMETLLGQVAKTALTDEALKKTYDDAAKAQKPETEIHARHILVATDDDAKAVIKRLKAGEDFAKVAKEVSKDKGSDGGDLGWFTKDKMVPEFAEAAFKLEPGQLSEPVKSPFGWHVIEVEGKREKPFPSFDEVKEQVSRYVVQKAQSELVAELRKGAKIERTEAAPTDPDAAKPDGAAATPAPAAPAPAAPSENKK